MGMEPVPGASEGEWTSWNGKERTRGRATGGGQAGAQRRREEGGSARGAQRASPRRGRVAIGQGGGRRMIPPLSTLSAAQSLICRSSHPSLPTSPSVARRQSAHNSHSGLPGARRPAGRSVH